MPASNSLTLMGADRVNRSLKRIAYQIAEVNKKNKPIVLLGINERGFLVAGKLAGHLSSIYVNDVKSIPLPVENDEEAGRALKGVQLTDQFLVLIDDVIFSGRTMFRALKLLSGHTELEEIHTAVLVDRGHRKVPVDVRFSGLDLYTKLDEHVSLNIDGDTIREVLLITS